MKKTAITAMVMGVAALGLLVASDPLGVPLADDVRGLLMALAGALTGFSGGALTPQVK